jgi:hypothetical protein
MVPSVATVLTMLGMVSPPQPAGLTQGLEVGMRTAAGLDDALVGPRARVYRAQPELMLRIRPGGGVVMLAGGGVGPALVVRGPAGHVDLSLSGAVGLRFPIAGTSVLAVTRAESVRSGATTVSLDIQLGFGR